MHLVHLAAGDAVRWVVPFSALLVTGWWRSSGFNLDVWAPDPLATDLEAAGCSGREHCTAHSLMRASVKNDGAF